jgi:dienelactone hydrolase
MHMPADGLEYAYSVSLGEKLVARNFVRVSNHDEVSVIVSKVEIFALEKMGLHPDRRLTKLKYQNGVGLVFCETHSERFGSHVISFADQMIDGQPFNEEFDWVIENNALGLLECGIRIMSENGEKSWRLLNLDDGAAFDLRTTEGKVPGVLETNLELKVDTTNDFRISSASPILKIGRSPGLFPSWAPQVGAGKSDVGRDGVTEREIILDSAGVHVLGTLCAPNATPAKCAAVFVGGSGVHDRNGNGPGVGIGYDVWARELAARGIASVRFDRYPFDENQQRALETTGVSKVISQITAALDYAKEYAAGRPLLLVGHSLGATLVAAAAHGRKDIDACVLLSASSKRLRDIVREQSVALAVDVTDNVEVQEMITSHTEEYLRTIDAGDAVGETNVTLLTREMLDVAISTWVTPGQKYAVIHGAEDIQVLASEGPALKQLIDAAGGRSAISILPERDHCFRMRKREGLTENEASRASGTEEAARAVAGVILDTLDRLSTQK